MAADRPSGRPLIVLAGDAGTAHAAYVVDMATALTMSVPCDHASDCFALEVYEEAGAPRHGIKSPLYDLMVQVLDGVVYVVAGDDEVVLTPGDSTTVRAGTPITRGTPARTTRAGSRSTADARPELR